VLGEEFKIGTQVHLLIVSETDTSTECAVGWITEWNDDAQRAQAMGFRADPNLESFPSLFAHGVDLIHDETGKVRPPSDRPIVSFHYPKSCPWHR
jgi:hypothetical protein